MLRMGPQAPLRPLRQLTFGLAVVLASTACAPSGQSGATASSSPAVVPALSLLQVLTHEGSINSVAVSPDGSHVLAAERWGDVWLQRTDADTFDIYLPAIVVEDVSRPRGATSVAFSRDGRFGLFPSNSSSGRWISEDLFEAVYSTATLWDLQTNSGVRELDHGAELTALALSPDGRWVLTGGKDSLVRQWDAATGRELRTLRHTGEVTAAAFTSTGEVFATAAAPSGPDTMPVPRSTFLDAAITLWDSTTGSEIRRLVVDVWAIESMAFSPDGDFLLSGDSYGNAQLWSTKTGEMVLALEHPADVNDVAFFPDGRWVLTGSDIARVWDVRTGEEVERITAHEGDVTAVAISSDGRLLVTAGADGTTRIWSARARGTPQNDRSGS